MPVSDIISPIEKIIADMKAGKMVILTDDEDRENEGDLIIPAENANAEAVNFMAKYGRGLICLALTNQRADALGLSLMSPNNQSRHQTAFTISIEAKEGVTTGISAADRAHTIQTAIDDAKKGDDLASPGHVFPLVARDGGVLVRAGHTEAAVDLAKLAGFKSAGVICEIMNDDGSMARLSDLGEFAKEHQLKIGTIADLIAYRRKHDTLIKRGISQPFETHYADDVTLTTYTTTIEDAEHVVLTKGIIDPDTPTLVRMHVLNVLNDVLGGNATIQQSLKMIQQAGSGVLVLLRPPNKMNVTKALSNDKPKSTELKDYGIGAQILLDLGVKKMMLLSNSDRTVVGLEGYDLEIVGRKPIT